MSQNNIKEKDSFIEDNKELKKNELEKNIDKNKKIDENKSIINNIIVNHEEYKNFSFENISRKDLKNIITKPLSASKGDSGSVLMIIGSSTYIGAGVLAGVAALRSGTDIVGIVAPEKVSITINSINSDLITYKLPGKTLTHSHMASIKTLIDKYKTILIGPGADLNELVLEDIIEYAQKIKKPLILDAAAGIQNINEINNAIILLNKSEYLRFLKKNKINITEKDIIKLNELNAKLPKDELEEERIKLELFIISKIIKDNTLLIKGYNDIIITKEKAIFSSGGSLRATVAGTGDVLAGLTAGLKAQNISNETALMASSAIAKRVAEILEGKKYYSFLASEYLRQIPEVMKEFKIFRVIKYKP